jgi:hypothetical protein
VIAGGDLEDELIESRRSRVIVVGDLEEDSRHAGVEEGDPAAGDHGSQHDLFDLYIKKNVGSNLEVLGVV